ncbi:MAG: hypothetical protein H6Q65_1110 [Firmicutes bacterium]|nr:hypothetical protein [Bacillota bacterium]
MNIPAMHKITLQEIPASLPQEKIRTMITEQLTNELGGKSLLGKKIGILAGSRGIRNLQFIIKTTIEALQQKDAEVFIIPAMGSHGGATAEGQTAILAHYGISEQELGVPVLADMKTTVIGDINGHPVYAANSALELDFIVPVNRIKAHTDFHGDHESGIAKMLVIGLGKRDQAEAVHQHGSHGLRTLIPQVAAKVLEHVPLLAAVAIIENQKDETARVEILNKDNLFPKEQELLLLSKTLLPKLPARDLDVLVVREMGKNISGVGIDPNITGRTRINGTADEQGAPRRIVVLDLTEESEGNASGMGIADVITERLYRKTDMEKTYTNVITSGFLERCFIPVIAATDEQAIQIALQTCGRLVTPETARIMIIHSTLELGEIYVSPAVLPDISAHYTTVTQAAAPLLDNAGNLI